MTMYVFKTTVSQGLLMPPPYRFAFSLMNDIELNFTEDVSSDEKVQIDLTMYTGRKIDDLHVYAWRMTQAFLITQKIISSQIISVNANVVETNMRDVNIQIKFQTRKH